jgi:DNA-binding NtrC family response regulator
LSSQIKTARYSAARVLIVEDELRLRELLADVVPDMGFSTVAVRSAEEATRLMEADAYEIVMLDLQLPVMGGMEFFQQIRTRWPDTQVVIMTGFGDLQTARQAIRLNVVDFITKPFHLSDVELALDRARKRVPLEHMTIAETIDVSQPQTLAETERQAILAALQRHDGNRTAAAAELGISRRKLHYWLNDNAGRHDDPI